MSTTSWVIQRDPDIPATPYRLPSRDVANDYKSRDSRWRQVMAAEGQGMEATREVSQEAGRQIDIHYDQTDTEVYRPHKGVREPIRQSHKDFQPSNKATRRSVSDLSHFPASRQLLLNNRELYDHPAGHMTSYQGPKGAALVPSYNNTKQRNAQHVRGIDRPMAKAHNKFQFRQRHGSNLVSESQSMQSSKHRNTSQPIPDLHSLPEIHQQELHGTSHDHNTEPSKSRRHLNKRSLKTLNTAPPSSGLVRHEPHGESNFELEKEKEKQLKYFIKHFNQKDGKSQTSNSSVPTRDLPRITGGTTVPRWFLGSVARSEHLDVARSQDIEDDGVEEFDPDLDDVTDAQEFYESYSRKKKDGRLEKPMLKALDINISNENRAPVWRTLPMQGELEKYMHFLKSGKGLDQKFSKYVGAHVPGKYRNGGPISRPRSVHKPDAVLQKPRQAEQMSRESKENSAQSQHRQPQEMNRLQRMTTMLN